MAISKLSWVVILVRHKIVLGEIYARARPMVGRFGSDKMLDGSVDSDDASNGANWTVTAWYKRFANDAAEVCRWADRD